MYQYNDNTFSKIMELAEISEDLLKAEKEQSAKFADVKAIHFGNSPEELETRKAEILNQENINEMSKRIDSIEKTVNSVTIKMGLDTKKDKILIVDKIINKF